MYYLAFLLVMATPLALLVIGLVWRAQPPKRDGSGLAYRTALSDRSDETWAFAHRHISRLWTRLGLLVAICVRRADGYIPVQLFRFFPLAHRRTNGFPVYQRFPGGGSAQGLL